MAVLLSHLGIFSLLLKQHGLLLSVLLLFCLFLIFDMLLILNDLGVLDLTQEVSKLDLGIVNLLHWQFQRYLLVLVKAELSIDLADASSLEPRS